ncbi:hypothetical protein DE146DRAFT_302160 [Phaeosphaeria sp. MPI-PUGE-AT-0046c]|nr:hypothetical protein DE146DRAFT_302160 [Phaeosphaeria sp. MPI-PUGE-AT-0046c]
MLERGEGALPSHNEQQTDTPSVSLSSEINTATRNAHTTLNRLITSRLPLALPPHAADPALYTTGLLHFAHIFLTFESLWTDLLRNYGTPTPSASPDSDPAPMSPPTSPLLSYLLVNPYDSPSFFTSTLGAPTLPSPHLIAFLEALRPRGLIRSARLKRDLEHLLSLHPTDLDVVLAKYPGEKVAQFCTHIRKAVHEKPWTLVSYAWCFYMAVFSGGRWIRAGLLGAGPDFWQREDGNEKTLTLPLAKCGLSFWHFQGQFDGEDVKVEFKTRLAAAETMFTPDQRVDIIEEAKTIFSLCASLVQELDDMIGTDCPEATARHVNESKADVAEVPIPTAKEKRTAPLIELKSPSDRIRRLVRKPEVTGTVVALACLACISFWRTS